MKNRFSRFFIRFSETILQAPLEVIVSVFYWFVFIFTYEKVFDVWDFCATFPISFSVVYCFNLFSKAKECRWTYYISLIIIPLLWTADFQLDRAAYWVSLTISQLLVLLSRSYSDNERFVTNAVNYLKDIILTLFLVTVGWLLAQAIYYSFVYIFDIDVRGNDFHFYSLITADILIAPVILLMFNLKREPLFKYERFYGILVNFILSPALLIYTAILYLYIGKIILIWSLPKGHVAYMVIGYIALMLVTKSVQPLLKKRYFDWYYNYFSFWALPALIMLWVSFLYRVNEYGFTEMRFYLCLLAIVLSLTICLFFSSRYGRYVIVAASGAFLLALFTYIPGIRAKDIGIYSQEARIKNAAIELGISDADGHLKVVADRGEYNDEMIASYRKIYNSFRYVERQKNSDYMYKKYGVSSSGIFRDSIVPDMIADRINNGIEHSYGQRNIFLYAPKLELNIKEFNTLIQFAYNKDDNNVYAKLQSDGLLNILRGDSLIEEIDISLWFNNRLAELGFDGQNILTQDDLEPYLSQLMVYRTEDLCLVMGSMTYDPRKKKIIYINIGYMLGK